MGYPFLTLFTIEDLREAYSGRSSGSRIILLPLPSQRVYLFLTRTSGAYGVSSPITAAGPLPVYTGFPSTRSTRISWNPEWLYLS